jgi:hypothetical protein
MFPSGSEAVACDVRLYLLASTPATDFERTSAALVSELGETGMAEFAGGAELPKFWPLIKRFPLGARDCGPMDGSPTIAGDGLSPDISLSDFNVLPTLSG